MSSFPQECPHSVGYKQTYSSPHYAQEASHTGGRLSEDVGQASVEPAGLQRVESGVVG